MTWTDTTAPEHTGTDRNAQANPSRNRQVIDIGTGFPTSPSPWEVAWDIAPDTRVIGVDNDATVLAHARAHAHRVTTVDGDLRDPAAIVARLDGLVDWSEPVALALVAVLHFLTEDDDPAGCLRVFRAKMAPGSRLVISHIARDGTPADVVESVERMYRDKAAPLVFRTARQILDLFDGFTLEDPGLVPVETWRPDPRFTPDLPTIGAPATPLVQGLGAVGVLETRSRHGEPTAPPSLRRVLRAPPGRGGP
ncbi:SAM-dependent methyltransferase [Actinomadura keratinilytica]|uniref:SAM-dependent methyltransferase n=1 Tax=Actinomadura keratinilytica TaxID=547461 RepID=A0ABP6UKJ8_9ACTN